MALLIDYAGKRPKIALDAFVAENATIIGDVTIEAGASIWYGAVLRGDSGHIHIGARTSVQDNVVIHVNHSYDTLVGEEVVIGHGAVLEGCTIGPGVLLGMNATVLSGARIGMASVIAAGAVVRENMDVPPGMLLAGVPAKIKRALTPELKERVLEGVAEYQQLAAGHRSVRILSHEDL